MGQAMITGTENTPKPWLIVLPGRINKFWPDSWFRVYTWTTDRRYALTFSSARLAERTLERIHDKTARVMHEDDVK